MKIISWSCALILGLAGLLIVGINLYVQSAPFQSKISSELSRHLGQDVQIERCVYTPWGGFKVSEIRSGKPGDSLNLGIEAIRIRPRLRSWLGGDWVLQEVLVENPRLVWNQNPDGTWRWGSKDSDPDETTSTPDPTPAREPTPRPETTPTPDAPTTPSRPPLERIRLSKGDLKFSTSDGKSLGHFLGLEMEGLFAADGTLTGQAEVEGIELPNLPLTKVRAPVTIHPGGRLVTEKTEALWAGGSARLNLDWDDANSHFLGDLILRDAEVETLLQSLGQELLIGSGHLNGVLQLHGSTVDPAQIHGGGRIWIEDAVFEQIGALAAAGRFLGVAELIEMRFSDVHADFEVRAGEVHFEEILLYSQNFRIEMEGYCSREGQLDLKGRLSVNPELQRQLRRLPGSFDEHFHEDPVREGYRQVSFHVRGNLEQPQTDLLEKLLGGTLDRQLQRWIGRGGSEQEN